MVNDHRIIFKAIGSVPRFQALPLWLICYVLLEVPAKILSRKPITQEHVVTFVANLKGAILDEMLEFIGIPHWMS